MSQRAVTTAMRSNSTTSDISRGSVADSLALPAHVTNDNRHEGDDIAMIYLPSNDDNERAAQAHIEQARSKFEHETGKTPEQTIADVRRALADVVSAVAPVVQSIITAWTVAWEERLYPLFHDAYLDAGAPYGDDTPGMLRWLREVMNTPPSQE